VVLRAPPGAGKTTRVPSALLDAGLAGDKQVLVLEPRRIAARAAAEFVARERGGTLGGEIGYRVRFETQGTRATRVWFLTEGIFSRQLVRDPFLESVAIVVLDEFHERHLQGDVALAVIRELQQTVRPDLKLVVMSATLDTERVAVYLDNCAVLTSEGKLHPVQIEYVAQLDDRPLPGRVATALRRVLANADDSGDVLVFLPGAAEIRRTATAIEPIAKTHDLAVVPLHGDLPLDAQQRALHRGAQRKVVLSTNVAETSLTIDGVTTVIDSGLARINRFDARHGLNALRVVPISRSATDQRAGRAGRTAPGRCLRLWTQAEHTARRDHDVPEVLRLDLSATVLELRAWGLRDLRSFGWLDAPSAASLARAEQLLQLLGAVDDSGALTESGRRMLDLSAPPRLARMLIEAERRGCADTGALLAALASERDICLDQRALVVDRPRATPSPSIGASDLLLRAHLFDEAARRQFDPHACRARGLDLRGVRAVERARRQLRHAINSDQPVHREVDESTLLRCLLAGFPDRVVRRRAPKSPRGVMVGTTGIVLADSSVVRNAEFFVAIEVEAGRQEQRSESRVRLASAIEPEWLSELFPDMVRTHRELMFDAARECVVECMQTRFHDLVLRETTRFDVDPLAAGAVLAAAAQHDPAAAVALDNRTRDWLARLRFVAHWMPELQLPSDSDALVADAVADLCAGRRSFAELRHADLLTALRHRLTPAQQHGLDREAPTNYVLPSGRHAAVLYEDNKPPAVAARIQELFGLIRTPRLAGGRVALVFQLLGPNQRPVQITDDLENFWKQTYPEVRKQLRGRYPKHSWPDDPLHAQPTSRVRRAPK
jgi:ATP-dependent helicase HrpB